MSGITGAVTRLGRFLGLDRNPLRRRTDRIESWVRLSACGLFLIGCVVGVFVGHGFYRSGVVAEQGTAHTYKVNARVVSVTSWLTARDGGYVPASARVAWVDRAGLRHTRVVVTSAFVGHTVGLWVDRDGHASLQRHTHGQTVTQAVVGGVSTVAIAGCAAATVVVGAALLIDRRRFAAWDREWLVVEPGWRRQEL